MKPSWIRVPLEGATGTPPSGWMMRGSDEGMVDAVEDAAALVSLLVGVALTMVDWADKEVRLLVAVGLIDWGAEVVGTLDDADSVDLTSPVEVGAVAVGVEVEMELAELGALVEALPVTLVAVFVGAVAVAVFELEGGVTTLEVGAVPLGVLVYGVAVFELLGGVTMLELLGGVTTLEVGAVPPGVLVTGVPVFELVGETAVGPELLGCCVVLAGGVTTDWLVGPCVVCEMLIPVKVVVVAAGGVTTD